jgi:hypothetical protein
MRKIRSGISQYSCETNWESLVDDKDQALERVVFLEYEGIVRYGDGSYLFELTPYFVTFREFAHQSFGFHPKI